MLQRNLRRRRRCAAASWRSGSLLPLLGLTLALAAPAAAQTERILLVGDSWAQQAWDARAFRSALQNKGLAQYQEVGGPTTVGGSTAQEWASPAWLALITQALQSHPTVDIVHLSIGGNDFFEILPDLDMAQLTLLLNRVRDDTRTVAQHILSLRPDARIAYSVYDYVPADARLSTPLGFLALTMLGVHLELPRFFLLNNLGLLHHAFGFPGVFGPGETPRPGGFPGYDPLLGGDPTLPGVQAFFDDDIHPSVPGYVRLAEHAIEEFYAEWLDPQAAIDLKPGQEPNRINVLSLAGSFPVALLGSEFFDVGDVEPASLAFGPSGAAPLDAGVLEDANGDGWTDLVSRYAIAQTGLALDDTQACLGFLNVHGVAFHGCDAVEPFQKSRSGCGSGFQAGLLLPPVVGLGRRARAGRRTRTPAPPA